MAISIIFAALWIVVGGSGDRPGDYNGDGDRDLADFAAFQNCHSRDLDSPGYRPSDDPACETFDWDLDGDVDGADLLTTACLTDGPGISKPSGGRCPQMRFTCQIICCDLVFGFPAGGESKRYEAPSVEAAELQCRTDNDAGDNDSRCVSMLLELPCDCSCY